MKKIFPCYRIIAEGENNTTTTVELPFTSNIDITRELQNSPAEASVTIYNLNKDSRENLYFDRYNFTGRRKIEIYLGYGGELTLCFKGNIIECYSVRKGVNFETHIEASDGGMYYVSGWNSKTYNNKKPSEQIRSLQGEVENSGVKIGKISSEVDNYSSEIIRPQSYFGKTDDNIKNIAGKDFDVYVENEELYVIKNDEVRDVNLIKICAETGLLETPRKMENTIEITMMLEPNLQIAQLVELESITAPRFNGVYKVIGVDHSATISENEDSENTTRVILLYNNGGYKVVQ